MNTPETANPAGADKMTLVKKLKEMIKRILGRKLLEEELTKAKDKQRDYESEEERHEEENRQEEKEKSRSYHEARSAEVIEMQADLARISRKTEVKERLAATIANEESDLPGSDYLTSIIRPDTEIQQALSELIDESSAGAEVIYNLISKGRELHGNSLALIKNAQRLAYEAQKAGVLPRINSLLEAVSKRVQELIEQEYYMAQRSQRPVRNLLEFIRRDSDIVTSGEDENLIRERPWNEAKESIDKLIREPRAEHPDAAVRSQWVKDTATAKGSAEMVAGHIVSAIDGIWSELERKETTGELSVDDLINYQRQIREEETRFIPKDVPPGSDPYNRAYQSLNSFTTEKYNQLGKRLAERLKKETPVVRQGITSEDDFLLEMANYKGQLGRLLEANPEMLKRFIGVDEEDSRFRDRVFLTIHSAVLNDQRNSSDRNFSLYEIADFTAFNDYLRIKLGKLTVKETRRSLGETLTEHYINLSNTIRQCRDIDYWASQPGVNSENISRSLGTFQNEYVKEAFNIPAVNTAFRAYETTLRSIMASNDGYIPPALIEYNSTLGTSFWDNWSQDMTERMIGMGSVPDVVRDDRFHLTVTDKDGHSVAIDLTKPLKRDKLSKEEIKMYMTLAKGMGIAFNRFIEMFAQQRIPGSDNPKMGMDQFHSVPYEGVAKALNYFNIFIEKWRIGNYGYFYLLNQLIPDEKNKIKHDVDSTGAYKAYMAYQDGTFAEKYGKDAKRFIDMTNFSGISSAIGKNTLWRQFDSTYKWSDKQKELLGGPTRLALADKFAEAMAKDYLIVSRYREEYRQEIIKKNQQQPGLNLAVSGAAFDKLWDQYGKEKYQLEIDREWDRLNGKSPDKATEHSPLSEETHHLVDSYTKAFKARIWAEMAMRNPLVVAHSLKVDLPAVATEKTQQMALHSVLVQDILKIPPEDTRYGEKWGKAVNRASPSLRQQQYMIDVLLLEGDLAAVREWAINEGRDLKETDFSIIKDKARRDHALEYWQKVKQVILGSNSADELYERFGMNLINGQDYAWNNDKIHDSPDHKHGISATLHDISEHGQKITLRTQDGQPFEVGNMLEEAVAMEPEWILGTDDMAFNRMDLLNLGSRQLLRRGGDIASHEKGGDAVTKYLMDGIVPNPDKHKLAEGLKEIRNAYSGDMIEAGWQVAGNLADMTDRLYAWDWKRLGSTAQLDVWRTRRNVAAWMANGRREFWDAIEHQNVLPPQGHFYYYGTRVRGKETDIHTLRKRAHADNKDVWIEFLILGSGLMLALTVWNALRARSEEEEGGGGHH